MATIIGISPTVVNFTTQTLVTVTHNLSYRPEVQVLDENGVKIGSPYIKHTDDNSFFYKASIAHTGKILYR